MPVDELLRLLADGVFHSPASLAATLGCSEADLARAAQTLADDGVEVTQDPALGYGIPGGYALLDADVIRAAIAADVRNLLGDLVVHSRIDSTNAELLRRGGELTPGSVCLAERQTAGRGQRGRAWASPRGGSIYLSVGWRFRGGAAALAGLSLAVGVALRDALDDLGVDGLTLKWPNDLLRGEGKLAGILVELAGEGDGTCAAVIGVGLNVRMPAVVGTGLRRTWADLSDLPLERNRIVASFLDRLLPLLRDYEDSGFAPWRERWARHHAWAGRQVVALRGADALRGVAVDVDADGALRLETAQGLERVVAGDVSLRPLP